MPNAGPALRPPLKNVKKSPKTASERANFPPFLEDQFRLSRPRTLLDSPSPARNRLKLPKNCLKLP